MTDYVSFSENDFREAFDEFYKSVLYKSGEFNNILLFNRKTECLYNMKKQPQQNPAKIVKRELNSKQIQHQNKPKHHR